MLEYEYRWISYTRKFIYQTFSDGYPSGQFLFGGGKMKKLFMLDCLFTYCLIVLQMNVFTTHAIEKNGIVYLS